MDNPYSCCPGPLPDGARDSGPEPMDGAPDTGPKPWPPDEDEPWPPEEPWHLEPEAEAPPRFWQGEAADELPPGPQLARMTEDAVLGLGCLSDNELIGVLHATRRQLAREQYKQTLVIAEFGRRRQAMFRAALVRGVPAGCRPGGFPGEELASELAVTRAESGHLIDDALDLTSRLPRTLAGMAAGHIDAERAGWIAMYTRSLTPADAARADEVLAGVAPDLRTEQVARKAAALEMKLNPGAVAARRERAKRSEQRVEARREASGNASLAGRELDTADVMASKAYLDAIAARLRASGLVDGPLDRLRALALTDLTQGRNPLDRLKPGPTTARSVFADPPVDPPSAGPSPAGQSPAAPGRTALEREDLSNLPRLAATPPGSGGPPRSGSPSGPGEPAPLPAMINLIVPAGTLLGWSAAPAQAGAWGLLDRDETRTVVTAAAAHPQTRWCVTLTGADGTALAHGCARGSHPQLIDELGPQPPPGQAAQVPQGAQLAELLRRLNVTFTPVARSSRDHATAEDGYVPSRKLRHVIRARNATCDAPACRNPAVSGDLDHTIPWPVGPTDQANLAPRCRTHHRAKQAPDWKVEQVAPGVTRWIMPSGRTHVTTPTTYDS